jgi:hypothetical protein
VELIDRCALDDQDFRGATARVIRACARASPEYTINAHLPVHDPIALEKNVGQLLEILSAPRRPERQIDDIDTAAVGP